jgi:hypothetical protein
MEEELTENPTFRRQTRAWANIDPIDPGTRQVVSDGIRVVYGRRDYSAPL